MKKLLQWIKKEIFPNKTIGIAWILLISFLIWMTWSAWNGAFVDSLPSLDRNEPQTWTAWTANLLTIIIYIPSVLIPNKFPTNSIIMGYAQLLPDKMFMRGIELDWVELS